MCGRRFADVALAVNWPKASSRKPVISAIARCAWTRCRRWWRREPCISHWDSVPSRDTTTIPALALSTWNWSYDLETDREARLQLRAERRKDFFQQLGAEATPLPFFVGNQPRVLLVLIKNARLLGGEFGGVNVQVGFVVQPERPIVEVGRADGHPHVIDDHHFAVIHGWLVF